MFGAQAYPTNEGVGGSCMEKNEAVQRVAADSLINGSAPRAALVPALETTRRAGVTTSQHLQEAQIPTEWRDDGAGDDEC